MHDKNGKPLSVGDIVTIEAKVTAAHQTEEYCNLSLETTQVMYPSKIRSNMTLNSKQVEWKSTPLTGAPEGA